MKHFTAFLLIFSINILIVNSQWIEQQSNTTVQLNCVSSLNSAVNDIHGWVCGNNGTVIKTTTNGTTWLPASGEIPPNVNLTTILGTLNNKALTAGITTGNTAVIYYTSNGGVNWQNTFSQSGGFVYGFSDLISSYEMLLIGKPVGNRWTIFKSSNNGLTWDSTGLYLPQSGNENGFQNSVFTLEGKAWFGTNNSRIYYKNGPNWIAQTTAPEVNSSVIWFQYLLVDNPLIGFGLSSGAGMLKSTNLGTTWNANSIIGSGNITGIAGSPSTFNKCWYSRANKIYTSYEAINWSLEYTAPSGNYTNLSNNKTGSPNVWAVRDNGGISKFTGQIGINLTSSEIPENFSLSQNYPNPFNPSTAIRFNIPLLRGVSGEAGRGVFASLYVYNSLGQKIAVLVNQSLSPGTYSVEWDASNYPSGLYFYTLTYGDFSDTKKMILLK